MVRATTSAKVDTDSFRGFFLFFVMMMVAAAILSVIATATSFILAVKGFDPLQFLLLKLLERLSKIAGDGGVKRITMNIGHYLQHGIGNPVHDNGFDAFFPDGSEGIAPLEWILGIAIFDFFNFLAFAVNQEETRCRAEMAIDFALQTLIG